VSIINIFKNFYKNNNIKFNNINFTIKVSKFVIYINL
jgi:hypothetical protein